MKINTLLSAIYFPPIVLQNAFPSRRKTLYSNIRQFVIRLLSSLDHLRVYFLINLPKGKLKRKKKLKAQKQVVCVSFLTEFKN